MDDDSIAIFIIMFILKARVMRYCIRDKRTMYMDKVS